MEDNKMKNVTDFEDILIKKYEKKGKKYMKTKKVF